MQGGFGLLFLGEAPDLVQDPFTFATKGTDALYVGQKLGFAIGFILVMHAAMTALDSPTGPLVAMLTVFAGMGKMAMVDNVPLPAAALIAAACSFAIVAYDAVAISSGEEKRKDGKEKKKPMKSMHALCPISIAYFVRADSFASCFKIHTIYMLYTNYIIMQPCFEHQYITINN